MKKILFGFLQKNIQVTPEIDLEHSLRIASASLMLEVVRADFEVKPEELASLSELLTHEFELSVEETAALVKDAHQETDQMVSLQHLTSLLNKNFEHAMKIKIVEMMWKLVYADGEKDRYEEHLIRQVADLLYLTHSEFIKARHKADPDM